MKYEEQTNIKILVNVNLPTFTIVIAIKNEPLSILLKTIESIKNIDYPNEKLNVIISDNSNFSIYQEQIIAIQSFYPNCSVKYLHNEYTNIINGKSANLNNALKFIDTDFLIVADADSRFPKNIIYDSLNLLLDANIGIIQFRRVDAFHNNKQRSLIPEIRYLFRDIIYEKYIAPIRFKNAFANYVGHNAIIRTSIAKELKGFDETILIEDSDFAIRVALHNYAIVYLPIETEDGTIDGFFNWQKRNARLVYGKTQLFFSIIKRFRYLSFFTFCSVFFHFGRFFFYYTSLIILIFLIIVSNNSYLSVNLFIFLIISQYPGPLMPSSNIIVFWAFIFFSNENNKLLYVIKYFYFSLILFFVNLYCVKYFFDYILQKNYTFISTKRN